MYRGKSWHPILLFLSILPAILLHTLLLGGEPPPTVKRSARLPLRFRDDGSFKILQVADMHYGAGATTRCKDVFPSEFRTCSDLNTTRFLRRMIEAERPDLVVFTGDNIFGSSTSDAAESLFGAFGPVMESKLPWAAILGNHDQESTMTREELMSFISLMDYSVSQVNPTEVKIPRKPVSLAGFGNYNIKVHGPYNSQLANTSVFNLYLLDSGDRAIVNGRRTYDWIKESQLHWLQQTSQELQAVFPAPALTFFHIPIPEVRELWFREFKGEFQEGVACSTVNSGVLDTLVSMGDVKVLLLGHDHLNDFCGKISGGIHVCYGGGFGYHAYGRAGLPRRARVVVAELQKVLSWTGVGAIRTWKRLDDDQLTKIDEQVIWEQ